MKFFQNKIAKNASWIIGCKIAQSLIGLLIGMLTARYLGPSNFGIINYAASMVAFATPIMQLGLNNIMVQEIVAFPERNGEILGTSMLMSFIASVFCIVGLFVSVFFLNFGETETILVCCLYSTILLFQSAELLQYWFQAKYLSKYSSIISFCAYVLIALYKVYLLIRGKSVYWFAIANAFDMAIIVFAYFIVFYKKGGGRLSINLTLAKKLLSKSFHYILSSMMFIIFAQTDRLMIKNILGNSEVGFYSAAITCAGVTSFVFTAVIDSFRPMIFEKRKIQKDLYEKKLSSLYCLIFYVALLQCVLMTLFAPFIINLLYGKDYYPAVTVLQLVVWFTTFSYMGCVRSIWVLAENVQRYLWIINFSGAFVNVVLNYFFIPLWGCEGAAIASVLTQFFVSFLIGFVIPPFRRNNFLMCKGINPLRLKAMLNELVKEREC